MSSSEDSTWHMVLKQITTLSRYHYNYLIDRDLHAPLSSHDFIYLLSARERGSGTFRMNQIGTKVTPSPRPP